MTGVQTCALPICSTAPWSLSGRAALPGNSETAALYGAREDGGEKELWASVLGARSDRVAGEERLAPRADILRSKLNERSVVLESGTKSRRSTRGPLGRAEAERSPSELELHGHSSGDASSAKF